MLKKLIEDYKLLVVAYGSDTGLVSLVTGDLLACALDHRSLNTSSEFSSVTFFDDYAEKLFGEEHTWNDVIGHLQKHYDWDRKFLPHITP